MKDGRLLGIHSEAGDDEGMQLLALCAGLVWYEAGIWDAAW